MQVDPNLDDKALIQLLSQQADAVIDILFRRHYSFLCNAVYRIIPDKNLAEDLVQDVFFELWKKRENLVIKSSVKAYLKRAAVNKSLNYLRDQKATTDVEPSMPFLQSKQTTAIQHLEGEEMSKHISAAIEKLPLRCRQVFLLSRFEAMSYQQIAEKLDISVKTVENQISKALKNLRVAVQNFTKTGLQIIILILMQ
ncbi:MAG: RNA polymerase sigma-70 factor [Saprospiraceae bacterium]